MALAKISAVTGRAVLIAGDDIDTDRIIPARFMKVITFDGLGEFAFYDERKNADGSPKPHPLNAPEHTGAKILVSGFNFGCGSSREHAPQALRRAGFEAVIAGSFAEIFFGNATTLGMPCVTAAKDDLAAISAWVDANPAAPVTVDVANRKVICGGTAVGAAPAAEFPCVIPDAARDGLLEGRWDAIADLLEGAGEVAESIRRLHYV